ncbi:spindle assembly abnormal protein 6 homolog isoform X2 [Polyodon spathula]|uniref:spindle assembly abnormal protein 6 homolog isoform X2 n=1 Tax=Polyodon spathula TaxID=7913 RepID=UPI001B7EF2CA|nr:spindle assembly abnormal protein 6 homolog isoform X2 [Polyodon spathula]
MTETLFNQILQAQVRCKDCEDRRANIRVSIELQSTSNPVHKKDLVVRITDDIDLYFLYKLVISEEDFQSLKVQQGLLVDFSAFPQKFIDLLHQCIQEQDKDNPRFLLQFLSSTPVLDHTPAHLNIVETNAFKHLTHLSLKLLHGTDVEIKKYLAICLACVKDERLLLEQKLQKTEEDLSRQLSCTQQTLSEKSRELDRLRSEWTSQTTALSNKHSQELTSERERALEVQTKYQQQSEQQRRELESLHQKNIELIQTRLVELETCNKELTERKYKSESIIREHAAKLVGLEDELHRAKQEVLSLRRENSTLDVECHEKEKHINQLQTRVAVLEQEIKDKDQLVIRSKEVLDATQEQKLTIEENAERRQLHIGKLETTVQSLSEELIKANEIIKKLQGGVKTLAGKLKLKNTVTIQQEKLLSEKEEKLKKEQKELHDVQQALRLKEEVASKLQEQLEATVQKLEESKQLLKTNENVITWLNKQLNENQVTRKQETLGMFETPPGISSNGGFRTGTLAQNMVSFAVSTGSRPSLALHNQGYGPKVQFNPLMSKPSVSPVDMKPGAPTVQNAHAFSNKENGEPFGLESKYFQKREDSIPLRGIVPNKELQVGAAHPSSKPGPYSAASAYFPGQ